MDNIFYSILIFETKIVMKKSQVVRKGKGTELKTLARMELLRSEYKTKSTEELIEIFENSIKYQKEK